MSCCFMIRKHKDEFFRVNHHDDQNNTGAGLANVFTQKVPCEVYSIAYNKHESVKNLEKCRILAVFYRCRVKYIFTHSAVVLDRTFIWKGYPLSSLLHTG